MSRPNPINKVHSEQAVRHGCRFRQRQWGYPWKRSHRVCRLILEAWYIEHTFLEAPKTTLAATLLSGEEPETLEEARAYLLEYDYRQREEEGTNRTPASVAQWAATWSRG